MTFPLVALGCLCQPGAFRSLDLRSDVTNQGGLPGVPVTKHGSPAPSAAASVSSPHAAWLSPSLLLPEVSGVYFLIVCSTSLPATTNIPNTRNVACLFCCFVRKGLAGLESSWWGGTWPDQSLGLISSSVETQHGVAVLKSQFSLTSVDTSCVHTNQQTYIHVHMHTHTHTHTYAHVYTHTSLTFMDTPVCMSIYICIHTHHTSDLGGHSCVHINTYTEMRTRTHTHTHKHI